MRSTHLITGITDDGSLATAVADRLAADEHRLVCTGLGPTEHHGDLSPRAASFLRTTYQSFEETVSKRFGDQAVTLPMDVTLDEQTPHRPGT